MGGGLTVEEFEQDQERAFERANDRLSDNVADLNRDIRTLERDRDTMVQKMRQMKGASREALKPLAYRISVYQRNIAQLTERVTSIENQKTQLGSLKAQATSVNAMRTSNEAMASLGVMFDGLTTRDIVDEHTKKTRDMTRNQEKMDQLLTADMASLNQNSDGILDQIMAEHNIQIAFDTPLVPQSTTMMTPVTAAAPVQPTTPQLVPIGGGGPLPLPPNGPVTVSPEITARFQEQLDALRNGK